MAVYKNFYLHSLSLHPSVNHDKMAPKQGNLKLPKSILDQIGESLQGAGNGRGKKGGHPQTRKEVRKAERAGKKALRSGPPPQKRQRVTQTHEDYGNEDEELESAVEDHRPPLVVKKAPRETSVKQDEENPKSILKKTKKADPRPLEDRGRSITPPPKLSRAVKQKLAEDDDEIAELEKKLGLKGRKNLPQSFRDDGLDDLLEGLDGYGEEEGELSDKKKRKSEADEWLEQKRRKASDGKQEDVESESEDDIHDDHDTLSEDEDLEEDEDMEDIISTDEDESIEEDLNGFNGFSEEEEEEEEEAEDNIPTKLRVRENPYVAPVSSNSAAKYIPPSLRKPVSSDSALLTRLRRQLQGHVNKLTETNLISILGEIEKVYRENARQHVTSTLVDLLLTSVCEPTSLPDTLIILPAGFISAVYKIVGTDFGAQIIQRITELFDEHYARALANTPEGGATTSEGSKETSNLIMLLSELYIFQMVGSNLLYDYIRLFLDNLSEMNAELLLRVIRAAGPQLRQDDPSSLKDIVALLRPAIDKAGGEEKLSVRTKFMIETIDDLKNNKMRAGGQASAVTSEHTIRMKKILGSLNTRSIKGSEPLRISLDDIRNSDKKGKWWLVGASWAGNTNSTDDNIDTDTTRAETNPKKKSSTVATDANTTDLFSLAKQHRMNTDIRRAIFVAIMSATDYSDAYMRLTKLHLKKVQEYEIPKVLIHCAGAEKAYNPYYTLISQKVCADRKLRTSFQFALWDLFRKMGEDEEGEDGNEDGDALDMRYIVNLAKLFGHLIAENALSIDVLKNLNLRFLQPKTKTFLEVLFVTALTQTQKGKKERDEKAVRAVFARMSGNEGLIRGVQYFVRKTVRKSDIVGGKKEGDVVKWCCEVVGELCEGLLK